MLNCVLYSGEWSDSAHRKKYIKKAQTINSPVTELKKLFVLKNGKKLRKKVSERNNAGLMNIKTKMNDETFVITVSVSDAGINGGVTIAMIRITKQKA